MKLYKKTQTNTTPQTSWATLILFMNTSRKLMTLAAEAKAIFLSQTKTRVLKQTSNTNYIYKIVVSNKKTSCNDPFKFKMTKDLKKLAKINEKKN